MAGMASMYTAVSGLEAARTALSVVGHNMANVDTAGYTRQRIVQTEYQYTTIGYNQSVPQQVGLGTDFKGIQQIRSKFLDASYREEVGKASFYSVKASAGLELEVILGELQSEYQTQNIMTDVWEALQELSVYQPGLDTRGNFISSCITFITKANNVYERLHEYQQNINGQIKEAVQDINTLVETIHELNGLIKQAEYTGDSANDYKDQRNLALDQLSALAAVDIKFQSDGQVSLLLEGNELLANGSIQKIGLKYSSGDNSLVEPILTSSTSILPYNAPTASYRTVYSLTKDINSSTGGDSGQLKALLVSRGYGLCNYASPLNPDLNAKDTNGDLLYPKGVDDPAYKLQLQKNQFDAYHSVIAKAQRDFDILTNAVVTMINDLVSPYVAATDSNGDPVLDSNGKQIYVKDPNAPYDLNGEQSYMEVFVRKNVERFDENGNYIQEDTKNPSTMYTIGNIQLNPLLQDAGGYTLIPFSASGDIEDTSIILDILAKWSDPTIVVDGNNGLSVDDYYRKFVTEIANVTNESSSYAEQQDILITQVDNKRNAMSGVSLDEELEFMLKYQHAYNAAARMINVIDEVLERLANLGRN